MRRPAWLVLVLVLAAGVTTRAGHLQTSTAPPPQDPTYRNLQVLQGVPARSIAAIMQGLGAALGVACAHCHVPDEWHLETKPTFAVARGMMRMVDALNQGLLKDTGGVSCWTCHGGQARPSRLPGAALDAAEAKWPAALASADPGVKLTMAVYGASLGVECVFCHVPGDWQSDAKAPFKTVATMNAMFDLFPKYMPPAARTQCFMCHKGSTTPRRAPTGRRSGDAAG